MHPTQQIAAAARLPPILDELVPTGPLAGRAVALATFHDHPAYDCFYLALVEQGNGTLVRATTYLTHLERQVASRYTYTSYSCKYDIRR